MDHFVEDCVFVDDDRPAEGDVEILKGDGKEMGVMHAAEIFGSRLRGAGIGDTS